MDELLKILVEFLKNLSIPQVNLILNTVVLPAIFAIYRMHRNVDRNVSKMRNGEMDEMRSGVQRIENKLDKHLKQHEDNAILRGILTRD